MKLIKTLTDLFHKQKKLSLKSIAEHEAAHALIWCIYRDNWTLCKLTIEQDIQTECNIDGALHITSNFANKKLTNLDHANQICIIVLAGLIGQNIKLIKETDSLIAKMMSSSNYIELFNCSGCGGDFDILKKHTPFLAEYYEISEAIYIRRRIYDLVTLFKTDEKVQYTHYLLAKFLLAKRTLTGIEVYDFFETNGFIQYISDGSINEHFID